MTALQDNDKFANPFTHRALLLGHAPVDPIGDFAQSLHPYAVVLNRHRRRWGILVPTKNCRWVLVKAHWCLPNSFTLAPDKAEWWGEESNG